MKKCVVCGKIIKKDEPFVGFCCDEEGFTYCMHCFEKKEFQHK